MHKPSQKLVGHIASGWFVCWLVGLTRFALSQEPLKIGIFFFRQMCGFEDASFSIFALQVYGNL